MRGCEVRITGHSITAARYAKFFFFFLSSSQLIVDMGASSTNYYGNHPNENRKKIKRKSSSAIARVFLCNNITSSIATGIITTYK